MPVGLFPPGEHVAAQELDVLHHLLQQPLFEEGPRVKAVVDLAILPLRSLLE
jgi:hypothetical protein